MRILIMTDSYLPTRDGVVTSVLEQRKFLTELGHEVVIMAPDPGPADREDGVVYLPAKPFKTYPGYFVPKILRRSKHLVKQVDPDIIHIRGVAVMTLKALMASHSLHIPTVLTYDTMVTDVIDQYVPFKMKKERLVRLASIYLRQALKRPNCIITPSDDTARELTGGLGVKPKRIERIPTPVDTARFHRVPEGEDVRRRYGLEGRRVAISVGRASFEKNTDLIIRSMRLMPDDVSLVIVGKGPSLEDWKKTADDLGMGDRVVFAGFVVDEELVAHYSAADIFVSASVFETQGLTTVEAMACGLPVACARGRAFLDYVHEGENGYLFDLSEDECSSAMLKAFNAPDEVAEGIRRTVEEFSVANVSTKLVRTYEEVITDAKERHR